jgi:hypothetical protein
MALAAHSHQIIRNDMLIGYNRSLSGLDQLGNEQQSKLTFRIPFPEAQKYHRIVMVIIDNDSLK